MNDGGGMVHRPNGPTRPKQVLVRYEQDGRRKEAEHECKTYLEYFNLI